MNTRFALIRENLGMTTRKFGERLNITGGAVTNMEKGTRGITDRTISDVCREFNVNEEWLRNGTGKMFLEPDTFSLDLYLKQRGMTEEELDIIKGVFEIPEEFRRQAIGYFKTKILPVLRLNDDIAATKNENDIIDVPKEKSISELEMEYKKNLLKNVSEQAATVSSITKDKKKAQ